MRIRYRRLVRIHVHVHARLLESRFLISCVTYVDVHYTKLYGKGTDIVLAMRYRKLAHAGRIPDSEWLFPLRISERRRLSTPLISELSYNT